MASILIGAASLPAATAHVRLAQVDGEPLEGAVVSAVPLERRAARPSPEPAVMDQRDKRFVPHVLPVQVGAEVRFANSDSISHHVYSFSPAGRFELYLAQGETRSVTFDEAGVVALGCNIHDWMLAYVVVLETPYFTRSDATGVAALEDLPPGSYRLAVFHPRIRAEEPGLDHETTIARDAAAEWSVRLTRALLPSRSQEPGFAEY